MDEDPGHQAVTKAGRTAAMTAAVAAEQLARVWRAEREKARRSSAEQAQRFQARYDAERALARAQLAAADATWARVAEPDEVARVWQTARVWAELEPAEFIQTEARLREEIREQRGTDVEDLASVAPVRDGAPEALDEVRAGVVAAGAAADAAVDREEASHGQDSVAGGGDAHLVVGYDTEQRWEQLRERMEVAGVEADAAAGRVVAAKGHAAPRAQAGVTASAARDTGTAPTRKVRRARTQGSEHGFEH